MKSYDAESIRKIIENLNADGNCSEISCENDESSEEMFSTEENLDDSVPLKSSNWVKKK